MYITRVGMLLRDKSHIHYSMYIRTYYIINAIHVPHHTSGMHSLAWYRASLSWQQMIAEEGWSIIYKTMNRLTISGSGLTPKGCHSVHFSSQRCAVAFYPLKAKVQKANKRQSKTVSSLWWRGASAHCNELKQIHVRLPAIQVQRKPLFPWRTHCSCGANTPGACLWANLCNKSIHVGSPS